MHTELATKQYYTYPNVKHIISILPYNHSNRYSLSVIRHFSLQTHQNYPLFRKSQQTPDTQHRAKATKKKIILADLIETTMAVLVHPCQAARLAAAWCLRCICVAVPSQITPLIDRCVESIENLKNSPEAITGYSSALAAVLGSVRFSPLGVPHTKGKVSLDGNLPGLIAEQNVETGRIES